MKRNKIIFEKLSWWNFLATGARGLHVNLTKSPKTLTIGPNSAGKSTFLDALCYVLYGKAFRNINCPQLVNTINNSDCKTQIEFTIHKTKYKIIRGQKPRIFEIWKNGKLLDQDAKSKDYQRMLEEDILRMSYKSFTQLIILGSSSFTAFMDLTPANRRAIIEDILDIKILSDMSVLAKAQLVDIRNEIQNVDQQLSILEHKKNLTQSAIIEEKRKISQTDNDHSEKIEYIKKEIAELKTEIEKLQRNIIQNNEKICIDPKEFSENLQEVKNVTQKLKTREQSIQETIRKISKDQCPECESPLSENYRKEKVQEKQNVLDKIHQQLKSAKTIETQLQSHLKSHSNIVTQIKEINQSISTFQNKISTKQQYLNDLLDISSKSHVDTSHCMKLEDEFNGLKTECDILGKQKVELSDQLMYTDLLNDFLKDSGIRSMVVHKYLPAINHLINMYLEKMSFPISFELNEQFSETIKSRHRDVFSYESFSEGEKFRINISILFAWREIASLRNSISCNILVMDEVFDSSLDQDGIEDFLNLLDLMSENTNIFVISHKTDGIKERFERILHVKKPRNFTQIEEILV